MYNTTMSVTATLNCAICGSTAPDGSNGWDFRLYDDAGEPLIWPYFKLEETTLEKWGRCPDCSSNNKWPLIPALSELQEKLVRIYLKKEPGASRARAFAKVIEALLGG